MLKLIAKLLKVLNSEAEPSQISLAICFAMVASFTPLLSPHNLIVLLLVLILRVNLSAFILGLIVLSGIAYALDPLFHVIGLKVLTADTLNSLWTSLYNSTLARIEYFNNTVVMGSLITSIVLFIPLLLVLNVLIRKYREHIVAWVQRTRLMQVIKASKFYSVYTTVSGWRS